MTTVNVDKINLYLEIGDRIYGGIQSSEDRKFKVRGYQCIHDLKNYMLNEAENELLNDAVYEVTEEQETKVIPWGDNWGMMAIEDKIQQLYSITHPMCDICKESLCAGNSQYEGECDEFKS